MKKRLLFGSGLIVLALSTTLIIWQGSFTFGEFGPSSVPQTYVFWAISTLVFLLTVLLGFMLARTALRLYVERQSNREGSRIKSKLVVGALALSTAPVIFLVVFSVQVMNRNLVTWFGRPGQNIRISLVEVGEALDRELELRAAMQARWVAGLKETETLAARGVRPSEFFDAVCRRNGIERAWLELPDGETRGICTGPQSPEAKEGRAAMPSGAGQVVLSAGFPVDLAKKQAEIDRYVKEYDALYTERRNVRRFYLLLLTLITLFVIFLATWIARFLASLISEPILALLTAASEVRKGNLSYRVTANAKDELATLVRAFNEMVRDLDANSRELERRRRFTEAILESIPTGVISLTADGRIQRLNHALRKIFDEELLAKATRLDDLFPREDASEIRYLMKRARRTGVASRQMELRRNQQTVHLSVTASALEEKATSGFVLVLEDTSELLRAQKAAAWHEVARRIAHEIKNPLTPIALCAERIGRQIERATVAPETRRILVECTQTIAQEVESVKTLVDEFSRFARFPAAQPVVSDLNEVVETALSVFTGRLDGIDLQVELGSGLPPVNVDRDQFKRVVVNLVDNAAEAMQDAPVRRLWVRTQAAAADTVELTVADSGCGVSPEDREKLFLPYFSTKGRGTGLGLAIVNHILAEHRATIRVEDNPPSGARFVIEIPAIASLADEKETTEKDTILEQPARMAADGTLLETSA